MGISEQKFDQKDFRLVVTSSNDTFIYNYDGHFKKIKIGRSQQCDFTIPLEDLSREHCLIEYKNNQFYITDLGSVNGVYINKERIEPHLPTIIDEETKIVLAKLYPLKILPVEVKKKIELVLAGSKSEIDTASFHIDIPKQLEAEPAAKRKKSKKIPKEKKQEPSLEFKENLKMILAFSLILIVVFYFLKFSK